MRLPDARPSGEKKPLAALPERLAFLPAWKRGVLLLGATFFGLGATFLTAVTLGPGARGIAWVSLVFALGSGYAAAGMARAAWRGTITVAPPTWLDALAVALGLPSLAAFCLAIGEPLLATFVAVLVPLALWDIARVSRGFVEAEAPPPRLPPGG